MFATESAVMPLWLDHVPEAVVVFDRRDKIQGWNRAAERLFRFSASDAIGQSLLIFVPHSEQALFAQACDATRKNGEWCGELQTMTALGDTLQIEARWELASETDVIVGLFSDVTQTRKQQELTRQASEWTAARTAMTAMMESLSKHEPHIVLKQLRTFLQAVDPLTGCALFRGCGERVLVVVRDPLNREFTRILLDAAGYRAIAANDRFHAARLLADFRCGISAGVVDYGTEAATVMAELRRWQPLFPIVSIGTTEANPFQAIAEPMDTSELLQAVAEAVAETKLREE